MQYEVPEIFRTETQRRLLVELLGEGDGPRTLTDLARAIDVDPTTVMREVDRLSPSGLISERRVGRARTVTIDESSPHAAPLRQLLGVVGPRVEERTGRPTRHLRADTRRHDRPLPSSRQ